MPDTFAITIIFIVFCTIIGAFVKGRSKDICLRNFSGFLVVLEKLDGKVVWGKLSVENSGVELFYPEAYEDIADGHFEKSYILYKTEYEGIKTVVRFIDDLDQDLTEKREQDLKKTLNPGWFSRFLRRSRNFFNTVRDSLLGVSNLFLGRIKTATPVGKVLKGQDKYVNQMQEQAVSTMQSAYEPILERYLGKKVVLALIVDGKKTEYSGILKDYTTEFIEILDVKYTDPRNNETRLADFIAPRKIARVRHLGE